MRRLIKKLIFAVFYYSGFNWIRGRFLGSRVFCIGYHSIFSDNNKKEFSQNLYPDISISSSEFEEQLLFLKSRGHSFIHISDLKKLEIQKFYKPTIIFFDDGFKDVLVNALPILRKYNIPATIFISTGLIDRTSFVWTSGLRYFLINKGIESQEIEKKINKFKQLSAIERNERINEIYSKEGFVLMPKDFNVYLNWSDVLILSMNNFEIGSHGVSHKKFTELDKFVLSEELVNSKKIIEEKINEKVLAISYPHGRFNADIKVEVKKAGYDFAVSTQKGINNFSEIKSNPFELKKIAPEPGESINNFKVRVYTGI